jgi:hypothetical protein
MTYKTEFLGNAMSIVASIAVIAICGDVQAQEPVEVGGSNGLIMGGGMGFKAGGENGVHFGGGQGAKFGPTKFGMHFGNGQGARFGSHNFGMQFGGGQGARFGTPEFGMQFGHGEGARFGSKDKPLLKFGGRGEPLNLRNRAVGTSLELEGPTPATPIQNTTPPTLEAPSNGTIEPALSDGNGNGAVSVLEQPVQG